MTNGKKTNGKSARRGRSTRTAKKTDVRKLTDAQLKKLRSSDEELGQMKKELADIELNIMRLEGQKAELANVFWKKSQAWRESLEKAAESLDIEPDPAKGKWRFDLDAGAFIRLE